MLDHFLHGVPSTPRELPPAADALVARPREGASLAADPPPVDLVR
jgi:hypothetical protein